MGFLGPSFFPGPRAPFHSREAVGTGVSERERETGGFMHAGAALMDMKRPGLPMPLILGQRCFNFSPSLPSLETTYVGSSQG